MTLLRPTTVTLVAEELRRRILGGELGAGAQLRQEALARELGVSRIPVREALRQLATEGLVEIASHRGAVVSSLSLDDISELFELRLRLECWLLELAIPRMTRSSLDSAEAALDEMIAQAGDIAAWGRLNWAFHRALYAPAGRARTLRMLERINQDLDRYVRIQIAVTTGQQRAHSEHGQILELCRRGETGAAVSALQQHISAVHHDLTSEIASDHGSGDLLPPVRARAGGQRAGVGRP